MDLLMWLVVTAFAVVGLYQQFETMAKNFKEKKYLAVAKAWILLIGSLAFGKILCLAKFSGENEYYAILLGFAISGIAQLGFEIFIKKSFIKKVIERVFNVKLDDEKDEKVPNE